MSERAPAFYALGGGGWRDWWTLLHPPYTLWHLAYVCLGAAAAPVVHLDRLIATLLAFFLAMGIGAHALDELNGRPLRTSIPSAALVGAAVVSVAAAIAVGVYGIARWTDAWFAIFIVVGALLVPAYNLEWFGGRLHTDLGFALAWGGFPALTSFWAQAEEPRVEGLLVAAGCVLASTAQRALSTPVRALRRRTSAVEGRIVRTDGTIEPLDAQMLRAPAEAALRALSLALPLVAAGVVTARLV